MKPRLCLATDCVIVFTPKRFTQVYCCLSCRYTTHYKRYYVRNSDKVKARVYKNRQLRKDRLANDC